MNIKKMVKYEYQCNSEKLNLNEAQILLNILKETF